MNLTKEIKDSWNLGNIPEDKKTVILEKVGLALLQALLVKSLDILSEDEQEELDKIMDANTTTPEEILRFLNLKIPTFKALVNEERENLKREITP
jgi:hypothetical protein